MVLWRISNYATLDGMGGLRVSGRWHTRGRPILYCGLDPSTCLLEVLVHLEIDAEDRPKNFRVLKIEGPDTLSATVVDPSGLPPEWPDDLLLTQRLGDRWLAGRTSLLLQVPSVLVPETWNMLINPLHPEAALLGISRAYEHAFDMRLFDDARATSR
jgi:RES domain-containing protein